MEKPTIDPFHASELYPLSYTQDLSTIQIVKSAVKFILEIAPVYTEDDVLSVVLMNINSSLIILSLGDRNTRDLQL
jgi:hypothetical protein